MGNVPLNQARNSIQWTIAQYSKQLEDKGKTTTDAERKVLLKKDIDRLEVSLDKLNHRTIKIAVFGLVSRGKSALINALVGQKILQTGALHGVTRWPRSVYWTNISGQSITDDSSLSDFPPSSPSELVSPYSADLNSRANQTPIVELIDTPGLEEVGGDERADIASDVAQQADLILFVISGNITRTEYRAIAQLRLEQKPILIVFNKSDLYPDYDRDSIAQKLNTAITHDLIEQDVSKRHTSDETERAFTSDDIICVAAEPAPIQVKTEWPNGEVTYEWESFPPKIGELKTFLFTLLSQESGVFLALNALQEAQTIEQSIAQTLLDFYSDDAEEIIWKFASWKAIAIALNPFVLFDLMGGALIDLVLIRTLARLYGLPMTSYEASKLWNAIVWSSLSLLAAEVGSGLLLGFGKSVTAFAAVFESGTGLAAYSTTAIAQATLAGYGTYRVGKAAQVYLKHGCSWGPKGSSQVMQDITKHLDKKAILAQLRRNIDNTYETATKDM